MAQNRESAEFWKNQRECFQGFQPVQRALKQYARFAHRFAGSNPEVPYAARPGATSDKNDEAVLSNLLPRAIRVFRSDLMLRNPRALVKTPGSYNRSLFTPLLARIETELLNDWYEECGFYLHMRRCLLDAGLAPYMVGKVTYDGEVCIDDTVVLAGREEAQMEDLKFITASIKPRMTEQQYHPAHIEQHEMTLAKMQRGEIPAPRSAIQYLKKHIQKHYEAEPWGRSAEYRRNQSVQFRRVNPLCYFYDPFHAEVENREWSGESFLARMEDIKGNSELSKKARDELNPIKSQYRTGEHTPTIPGDYLVETPDAQVRIDEYVDNVSQKVIWIAEGGTVPLKIEDYQMRKVQPSGPFIEGCFIEHPLHNTGVCRAFLTQAHQDAASMLDGIQQETAERSPPLLWYNSRVITTDEAAKMDQFIIAGKVPLSQIPDGTSGTDHIGRLDPLKPSPELAALQSYHRNMVYADFGGQAKLGGGDVSNTATASEVSNLANQSLSDDDGSVLDDFLRRVSVQAIRYMRTFYNQARVAEIVGEHALEEGGWPEDGFADRDVLMDRGIAVVPGSSRRNTTAIDSKQLQEAIAALAPLTPTLLPPDLLTEVVRQYLDSLGVTAVDWDGVADHMVQQQVMAAMQGQGQENPQEQATEGAGDERPSEMEEPSMASQAQGMANVTGGRVPGGAGVGVRAQLAAQRRAQEATVRG